MMISLVVPVKNEEGSIKKLLRTILAQTRAPDEAIFVDAGSTDRTRELITSTMGNKPGVKVLSIGAAYPGTARNAGVENASYETIAFTDGGIELDKDWLRELASAMEGDPSCGIVYGSYIPVTDTFFKKCLALAVVPPAKKRTSFIASSLVKKPAWRAVGGFPDFRAAEDRIFMEAIEKKGVKTIYNPKAAVAWDIPSDIKSCAARFYNYSYHDLKAGRGKDWHIPVIRMYLAALALAALGVIASPLFFILLAALFAARIVKKIYINRNEPYFEAGSSGKYFFLTGIIIFAVDLAMFSAMIRYMVERPKR